MTGKWEFDESGIPEFVCECEYCLGFQDDIPEECANNELPTSEWNIAPNYIGVGSELVEVN